MLCMMRRLSGDFAIRLRVTITRIHSTLLMAFAPTAKCSHAWRRAAAGPSLRSFYLLLESPARRYSRRYFDDFVIINER